MTRRLYSLGAVMTVSVALIAGCGGSSNSTPPKTTPAKTPPAKTTPKTTPATTPASTVPASALKAAGTACHTEYAALGSAIGGGALGDLQGICTAFSTGNINNVKAAVDKFCSNDLSSLPAAYQAALQKGCANFKKVYGG